MAIKKFLEYVSEKHIFYFVLALNVALFFTVKFYPTLDGPAHLYNSNVVVQILADKPIASFYTLNNLYIPNWTGHFILSIFNAFLPGWIAEKILLIFYLIGLSLSFRVLVKALHPGKLGLSVLIFPFAYSFLFYLGFYNYCISFIFLFLTLYYWVKTHQRRRFVHYLALFVFLALTYYSALLTFFFAGLCMGLYTLAFSIKAFTEEKWNLLPIAKNAGHELLRLFLISLPLLVFAFVFISSVSFAPPSDRLTPSELIKWLVDVRCLIVYNYAGDAVLTRFFLLISLAIASISVFMRLYRRQGKFLEITDIILAPFLLALLLFLIIPTSANAGMMSDRFCLLLYIFFIVWLSVQTLPKIWGRVFMGLIVILHIGLLFKHHNGSIRNLDNHAISINNVSQYMKENSVVLPVNMSDNWLELHFSNYLGVDKPLVILENYEASVGWFPVKCDADGLSRIQAAGTDQIQGLSWLSNLSAGQTRQIDYIFVYGNINKLEADQWFQLREVLNVGYKLVFTSADKYVALYEVQTKI